MSGGAHRHRPDRDRGAALSAAQELVRLISERSTVASVRLPVAMTLLEACGGDPYVALYTVAGVVNTALTPRHQPFRPGDQLTPVAQLPQGEPE